MRDGIVSVYRNLSSFSPSSFFLKVEVSGEIFLNGRVDAAFNFESLVRGEI